MTTVVLVFSAMCRRLGRSSNISVVKESMIIKIAARNLRIMYIIILHFHIELRI